MEYKKKKLLEFDENMVNSKKEDDYSGYEIDDSGMIPKLEELKAQKSEYSIEKEDVEKYILEKELSGEDVFSESNNTIDELFDGYEEIIDDEEDELDEYEKMFNFDALDHLDRDISDIKIDFYDDDNKSDFEVLNEKLDRIADSLDRIANILEKRR